MKKSKKARKVVTDVKKRQAHDVEPPTKSVSVAAQSVRSEAARRTAAGKFTKVIFNQIGGKECPRFAPMTWVERDKFMAKPEGAAVKARYDSHMKSVGAK